MIVPTECYDVECKSVLFHGFVDEGMTPIEYYFNAREVKVEFTKIYKYGSFRLRWEETDQFFNHEDTSKSDSESGEEDGKCAKRAFSWQDPNTRVERNFYRSLQILFPISVYRLKNVN